MIDEKRGRYCIKEGRCQRYRGFVNDGMEIHGMKDKETVTVTDKLEATQTRKLIDNINAEEDKLVASRTTKMPIKEAKKDG